MKMPPLAVNVASLFMTSIAVISLQDAVAIMIPWMMAITAVVVADLVVGLRKSLKLGVHVSISLAGRETMGKLIVYNTIVLGLAMTDVASGKELAIAKGGCLFVCALEGVSIIGNLLKPYGIDISLKTILKMIAKKKLNATDEEAEELVSDNMRDEMIRREKNRWEYRKEHEYGGVKEK